MTSVQDHPAALRSHGSSQHVDVTQVGGVIGAVVGGIRIGGDVSPAAVAELRAALLRHKVVFLRDQQHATDTDQRAFARLLGILTKPHPTLAGDAGAVLPIDAGQGKANSWHTDVTFVDRVPASSVLRHIDVREEGYREEFRHLEFETEHLVVRVHPETGEPALLLGHFVRSFPGLGTADFDDQPRLLHRITIAGDIPVGINGDTSIAGKGDASHYSGLAA